MQMIIDSDDRGYSACSTIEQFVASRYSVHPQRSYRAYEEFLFADGDSARTTAYTFAYRAPAFPDPREALAKKVWEDIKGAWPPGTMVIWREYPVVEEYKDESGECVNIWLRLGAFTPPANNAHKKECDRIPPVGGGHVRWR